MKKLKRLLAVVLVAMFFIQPFGMMKDAMALEPASVVLQNAECVIPSGADEATIKQALFDALVAEKNGINSQELSWEYYCQGKNAKGLHLMKNEAWGSVFGFTSTTGRWIKTNYNHPALADNADGKYTIRLSGGTQAVTVDKKTAANKLEVPDTTAPENGAPETTVPDKKPEVVVPEKPDSKPAEKPTVEFADTGVRQVAMVYADAENYDYEATAKAIYDAVIKSATYDGKQVPYDAIKVEHGNVLIPNVWASLSDAALGTDFGIGKNSIKISCASTDEYKGTELKIKIEMVDARKQSQIVLNENAKITYNMNPDVMKQEIIDKAINWKASTLPGKDKVKADDFVIEYKGINILPGNINGVTEGFAPVEGGKGTEVKNKLLDYPQMGAKVDPQDIRIFYKKNADYKASNWADGHVTVDKADINVKVKPFAKIKAGENLPADFITIKPDDKFDVYTVYTGLTSDVTAGIYVDLPKKYTESWLLKILNPIVGAFNDDKNFTDIINDGMTVGEFREFFNGSDFIAVLEELHISTGTFGEIIKVIDKMPSVMDSARVSFGTPNRAGSYAVTVITDNVNYNTGIGVGSLTVKKQYKDNRIVWNADMQGKKISAEEAKTFDFGATLFHAGQAINDKCNIKYVYTGFTSKWIPYASGKAPTQPGRYMVTAYTVGGNFFSLPVTRTFQITK